MYAMGKATKSSVVPGWFMCSSIEL